MRMTKTTKLIVVIAAVIFTCLLTLGMEAIFGDMKSAFVSFHQVFAYALGICVALYLGLLVGANLYRFAKK